MKRLLLVLFWLLSVVAAYQFGSTRSFAPPGLPGVVGQLPLTPAERAPATTSGNDDLSAGSGFDSAALARGDWEAIAQAAWSEGTGAGLLAEAVQLAESGRGAQAIALVEAYFHVSGDQQALFSLSDLLMMDGQMEAALEPLLQILDYPESPELAAQARRRLNLIINAREQQLANTADTAALISFFQGLVVREPAHDGHRLKLARWLLRAGDLTGASAIVQETGTSGITAAERDLLAAEIAAAASELPIEREGAGYFATVRVVPSAYAGTHSLRLLVDTGATTTSFSAAALAGMGARRLDRRVRVNTANGLTEMDTYLIDSLQLGDLMVTNLTVLALPSTPGSVDGLLGMDVLDRLPKAVGTPRKAR